MQLLIDLHTQPTPGPDLRSYIFQYAVRHGGLDVLLQRLPRCLHLAAVREGHCVPVTHTHPVLLNLSRADEATALERMRAHGRNLSAATDFTVHAPSFTWTFQAQASFLVRYESMDRVTSIKLLVDFAPLTDRFSRRLLLNMFRPQLLVLDLSCCDLYRQREQRLLQSMLATLPNLQVLCLAATGVPIHLPEDGAPPPPTHGTPPPTPLKPLSSLRCLRDLNLSLNRVPAMDSLPNVLKALPTALEALALNGEASPLRDVVLLADAASGLARLSHLTSLSLTYKTCASVDAAPASRFTQALADCFSNLTVLCELDLSFLDLHDNDLAAVLTALVDPGKLTSLNLSGNPCKFRMLELMEAVFSRMTVLVNLQLDACALAGSHVESWAKYLSCMVALETLDAGGNGFSLQEQLAITDAVATLPAVSLKAS
jgi:hypothetical protein